MKLYFKYFIGCFIIMFSVNIDAYFDNSQSNIFGLQFIIETILVIIGILVIINGYKNDRTINN